MLKKIFGWMFKPSFERYLEKVANLADDRELPLEATVVPDRVAMELYEAGLTPEQTVLVLERFSQESILEFGKQFLKNRKVRDYGPCEEVEMPEHHAEMIAAAMASPDGYAEGHVDEKGFLRIVK